MNITFKDPSVWAVVPCFNRQINTIRFLNSFKNQSYLNKNVVIVDDGSTDNTYIGALINYPCVKLVRGDGNLWWSGGTNLGIECAISNGADYILTINDDSQFGEDMLSILVNIALKNEDYIVGSVIVEDLNVEKIWSVGSSKDITADRLMKLNYAGLNISELEQLSDPYPVEFMPGNGVLYPRRVFETVGYFDEISMPQYHADSELVLRASTYFGFKPVIALKSRIRNHIIDEPLVNNLRDLIFSKKSDLYWPAVSMLLLRYYPEVDLKWAFSKIYGHFFEGQGINFDI
jgi:GT2 family glycosyltransferase